MAEPILKGSAEGLYRLENGLQSGQKGHIFFEKMSPLQCIPKIISALWETFKVWMLEHPRQGGGAGA